MPQDIIVNITTKQDGITPGIEKLDQLHTKVDEVSGSVKKQQAIIDDTTSSVKKYTDTMANAQKVALGDYGAQAIADLKKALSDTNVPLQVLRNSMKQVQDLVTGGKAPFQLFGQGGKAKLEEMNTLIAQARMKIQEFNEATEEGSTGTTKIRSDISTSVDLLAKMLISGEATAEQIWEMAKAGGELKDKYAEAQAQVNMMANNNAGWDAMREGIKGVTGAVQVGAGLTSLFGKANEDAMKTVARLNEIMIISQGINELVNLTKKDNIAYTYAQVQAEKLYAFVVGQSTGAVKALKLVIASTGVGFLLIALFNLATNFDKVAKAIRGTNLQLEANLELAKKGVDASAETIKGLDLQIKYMKLAGMSEESMIKVRQIAYEQQIKNIKGLANAQNALIEDAERKNKTFQKWKKAGFSFLGSVFYVDDAELQELKESGKKLQDQLNEATGNFLDTEIALKELAKEKDMKRQADAKKALEDWANTQKKLMQDDIDRIRTRLLEVEKNSKAELELKEQLILAETKLANFQATIAKQELQNAQAQADILEIESQYNVRKLEIAKQLIQDKLDVVAKGTRQELALQVQMYRLQEAMEVTAMYNSAHTAEEKEKLVASIKKKYRAMENNLFKAFLQEQKDLEAEQEDERQKIFMTRAQEKRNAIEEMVNAQIEATKKLMDEQEKAREMLSSVIDGIQQQFNSINQLAMQNLQKRTEEQVQALTKQKDKELRNHELTEAQKNKINERYAKQVADLRTKQAIAEKQQALANIAMNSAMAEIKIYAQTPPPQPAFFISTAMLAIATALQLATVGRQPIPQFEKGTKSAPPGFKWVGEAGPELIHDQGGYPIITNQESRQLASLLDKYGIGHTIGKGSIPDLALNSPNLTGAHLTKVAIETTGTQGIDHDKLGRAISRHIAQAMKDDPKVHVSIDKNGIHTYLVEANARTEFLTNEYQA